MDQRGDGVTGRRWGDLSDRPADVRLAVMAGAAMVGALWLPWAEAGAGDAEVIRGWDLWSATFVVPALAVVALVTAFAGRDGRRSARVGLAAVGFVASVATGLAILIAESFAALPGAVSRYAPAALGHLGVRARGGVGLWAVAVGGALLIVAASGATGDLGVTGAGLRRLVRLLRERNAAVVMAATAVAVAVTRYEPWVAVEADVLDGPRHAEVAGFSLPWIGPALLVSVGGLGVAALVGLVRPGLPAALTGILSAWFASFLAAVILVVMTMADDVRLDQVAQSHRLPRDILDAEPRVVSTDGPLLTLCAATLGGLAATVLLARSPRLHTARMTARSRIYAVETRLDDQEGGLP